MARKNDPDEAISASLAVSAVTGEVKAEVRASNKFIATVKGALQELFSTDRGKRIDALEDILSRRLLSKARRNEEVSPEDLTVVEKLFGRDCVPYFRAKADNWEAVELRSLQLAQERLLELGPGQPRPPDATDDSDPRRDLDWFLRFREDASLVSEESVREAYAHVAAEELVAPGTISRRTLDVLRKLDGEAARLFSKMLPHVVDASFVWWHGGPSNPQGFSISELTELADCGFVTLELINASYVPEGTKATESLVVGGWHVVTADLRNGRSFAFPAHRLTRAGRDLARVASIPKQRLDLELFVTAGRLIGMIEPPVSVSERSSYGWDVPHEVP